MSEEIRDHVTRLQARAAPRVFTLPEFVRLTEHIHLGRRPPHRTAVLRSLRGSRLRRRS